MGPCFVTAGGDWRVWGAGAVRPERAADRIHRLEILRRLGRLQGQGGPGGGTVSSRQGGVRGDGGGVGLCVCRGGIRSGVTSCNGSHHMCRYLTRKDFLERCDVRQFEKERDERLLNASRK